MELKLSVSKILILDTEFKPEMLNDNQGVVCEIDGKSVLVINVDLDEITKQAREYEQRVNTVPTRDWFDINDF